MSDASEDFPSLDRTGRGVGAFARRPGLGVVAALILLIALAWLMMFAMALELSRLSPLENGPGTDILAWLPHLELPVTARWLLRLCVFPAGADSDLWRFVALAGMWFLMSAAMMLPSATPMIATYCEIADTARGKSAPVVHPLVLVAGYLSTWLAASFGFAMLTSVLGASTGTEGIRPLPVAAAAIALAFAGLYQFTSLKDVCLTKCRNPFATLFAHWSDRAPKIFRLGVLQGIWCLGCCWALMLVMFAVGVMNPFWMALLALFAVIEKQASGPTFRRTAGAILLVWAGSLLVLSA